MNIFATFVRRMGSEEHAVRIGKHHARLRNAYFMVTEETEGYRIAKFSQYTK